MPCSVRFYVLVDLRELNFEVGLKVLHLSITLQSFQNRALGI